MSTLESCPACALVQQVGVVAAIGFLHVGLVYLLNVQNVHYNRGDSDSFYAEVLPADRRQLHQPSVPDVYFQPHARVTLPVLQVTIDDAVQEAPSSAPSQAIQPEP